MSESQVPSQSDRGGSNNDTDNAKKNADNGEDEGLTSKQMEEKDKIKSEYEQREFQTYLFERAKQENVIICLPTGCGKTFIAVQLVKHYLPESVRNGKKIMFLAPTVQLVHQQGNYLSQHISMSFTGKGSRVTVVTGDMKPEDWSGERWKTILAKSQVFAMTDQILREAIERAHVKWDSISLLILDECHNAQKNSPMAVLMESYCKARSVEKDVPSQLPRVLGLTATIIKGNVRSETIRLDVLEMERRFLAKAITYKDYEKVLKCATSAKVTMLTYAAPQSYEGEDGLMTVLDGIKENLKLIEFELVEENDCVDVLNEPTLQSCEQVFSKTLSPVKEFVDAIEKIKHTLEELGPYCALNAALKNAAYIYKIGFNEEERGAMGAESAVILLVNYILTQLDIFMRHIQDYMSMYSEPLSTNKDFICKFISPKLKVLIETLESTRSSSLETEQEQLCGLIFCQTRFNTQMVSHYLQELSAIFPERFGFIRSNFVIGGSSGKRNELAMRISLATQQDVLNRFRQKELNLLVCTNVLEEGLNVPSCNFVLRFDPIVSFPSYVQSMGRARQRGARFYTLVEESAEPAQSKNLQKYENFGKALSECLRQNVDHPENYFDDLVNEGISDSKLNEMIPPFSPEGEAVITAGSAIQIVYQYCQLLACDLLCVLTPRAWWTYDASSLQYKAFVIMPPNSAVKKAEGGSFSSKFVAKKSVFMEVCKKLYEAGALHPSTLLPVPRSVPLLIDHSLDELEKNEEKPKNGKKIGSKNRTTWYTKHTPEVFDNFVKTRPEDRNEPVKMYAIILRLKKSFSNGLVENEELVRFESRAYLFGILTHADLKKVPDSLLLSRDGNFTLHLEEIIVKSSINQEEIAMLKDFQSSIFSDLLGMKHVVLKEMDENPFYIVPLRTKVNGDLSQAEIAWELVPKLQVGRAVDYNQELEIQERREMTFEAEKYYDAVCIPSYSGQYHDRQSYCILSVQTELTPLSPFDDIKIAPTYEKYYDKKYNITIVHKEQPLIRGKARPKQLNYLVTKYDEWKMTPKERKEVKFSKRPITLIPELVRIHPLPASLFVQAKMLPSCLHRVFRLLIAEEIRESVAHQFHWFETQEAVNQRNGTLLEDQNNLMSKVAKPLMNIPIEAEPKPGDSVIVKRPGSAVEPFTAAGLVSRSNDISRIFGAKRKLLWCQIEYIHPKQIKLKEHIGAFRAGGYDEEESESEEESDVSSSSSSSTDLESSVLSAAKISQIHLIDSKNVPFQNFDASTNFEESKGPLAWTIMEAITLANANDAVSLEKLEMIGDSVLKFIATTHIFSHFPEWNEGNMTSTRMRLICNKHLYILGKRRNLAELLAGSLYEPETSWLPPGQHVRSKFVEAAVENEINYAAFNPTRTKSGELVDVDIHSLGKEELCILVNGRVAGNEIQGNVKQHTSYTHSRLGDKNIADCVEALIGAYYLHGGIDSALCLMKWIGLQGPSKGGTCFYENLKDLPNAIPEYPDYRQDLISDVEIEDIESTLDYTFKNKWLLVEALTHPSCMKNTVTSAYERLEFLGDAVLDFLVTHFIYKTKKAETPGMLTDLRSALVNNVTFGSLAVRYGFHKVLMHFSSDLQDTMDMFEQYQLSNGHKVTGHFKLVNDEDCLMAQDVDVPKALGDIFESIAGAVFLDSGMSLDTVWTVFYRLMKNEFDIFSENIPKAPIREIYELFPGKVKFTDDCSSDTSGLKVVKLTIPGIQVCKGAGTKKSSAKQAAAKFALKVINTKKEVSANINKLKGIIR